MAKVYTTEDVFVGEMFIEQSDEYYTTEYLMSQGVPFSRIRKAVEQGKLVKLSRGVYASPEAMEDEYFLLQIRYGRGVYSDYSAMFLHNMSDHIPGKYYMTFPRGYNCHSLSDEQEVLSFKRTDPKFYKLGLTEVTTPYGNEVRAYDMERTLCDIVRGRGIDRDLTKKAMRSYLRSDEVDLPKLMDYAETLHVSKRIHAYVDVMI